ncbi:hypothetical protein ElyMa_000938400 [Elysia marginata]|uniref:Uncharacterized protein n=1 Tax=Elysia marginata TaxID=1093978 RepID=A0AAV4HDW2_9GAST|nr:hypothetical protein ElyMa_000938400 [Elysia marginata]
MLQLPWENNLPLLSSVHPSVKWVPSYRLQMYWSAGALVVLLCGDTVTLSDEDHHHHHSHHHHHQVPCLEQALTVMAFQICRSQEDLMNWLLVCCSRFAQVFRLST